MASKGNPDVTNAHEDLCKRCARTPWEKLADRFSLLDEDIPTIHEGPSVLLAMRCRVCRLWGQVLSEKGIEPPYQVVRRDTPMLDSQQTCGLSVEGEVFLGSRRQPDLIATYLDEQEAQSQLQHLYPASIDIRIIKSWIKKCVHFHGASCKPLIPVGLKEVKVIDCSQRTIVAAPSDCQYVALSYVWGRQLTDPEPAHDWDSGQALPKTIEDSISMTRALGYNYLWVDKYVCHVYLVQRCLVC